MSNPSKPPLARRGVYASLSCYFLPCLVHLDPGGKYVVLHAVVHSLPMVLVGLYIPPPATVGLLTKVAQLVAAYPVAAVILAGDFTMVPWPNMDKLTPDMATDSPLSNWSSTFGLMDVWRCKHPRT